MSISRDVNQRAISPDDVERALEAYRRGSTREFKELLGDGHEATSVVDLIHDLASGAFSLARRGTGEEHRDGGPFYCFTKAMTNRCTIMPLIAGLAMLTMAGCDIAGYYLQRSLEEQCDCFLTPCQVSETLIQKSNRAGFILANQRFGEKFGCIYVSVDRHYENDYEKTLIMKAESIASTTGPTWVSTIRSGKLLDANGDPLLLIAGAVNAEALSYYADRILSFQQDASPENPRITFDYNAFVGRSIYTPNDAVVVLRLYYDEQYGAISADFCRRNREVRFDEDGNVTDVIGDDVDPEIVIN